MITKQQVENAQNTWGDGVVKIGSLKEDRSECEDFTNKFLDKLYAFELGAVSFKPTKCASNLDPQNLRHCLILLRETTGLVKKIRVLLFSHGLKSDLRILI